MKVLADAVPLSPEVLEDRLECAGVGLSNGGPLASQTRGQIHAQGKVTVHPVRATWLSVQVEDYCCLVSLLRGRFATLERDVLVHEESEGLSSQPIPNLGVSHPVTCSRTFKLENPVQKAEPLGCHSLDMYMYIVRYPSIQIH